MLHPPKPSGNAPAPPPMRRFLTEFYDPTTGHWEPLAIRKAVELDAAAVPWCELHQLPMPRRDDPDSDRIIGMSVRVVAHGQTVLEGRWGIFGKVGCWQDHVLFLDDGRMFCQHGTCTPDTHQASFEAWEETEQRRRLSPEQYKAWRQNQAFVSRVLNRREAAHV